MNFSLPKKGKLKSKKRIEKLFSEGSRIKEGPLQLVYCKNEDGLGIQVGFSAPKRSMRFAVHRNRIKRLLRESYRLQISSFSALTNSNYSLMFVYIGKQIPKQHEVHKLMELTLTKWVHKLN